MLELNYRDARPIYEQIMESIRRLIVSGSLQAGEKLPSIRELAAKLAINPNTIERAYRKLEEDGYVYTVNGDRVCVSENGRVDKYRTKELLQEFDEVTQELLYLSVEPQELVHRLEQLEERLLGADDCRKEGVCV